MLLMYVWASSRKVKVLKSWIGPQFLCNVWCLRYGPKTSENVQFRVQCRAERYQIARGGMAFPLIDSSQCAVRIPYSPPSILRLDI